MQQIPQISGPDTTMPLAQARAVAVNPERHANNYQLRLLAWAALKSARGQQVRQSQINALRNRGQMRVIRTAVQHEFYEGQSNG